MFNSKKVFFAEVLLVIGVLCYAGGARAQTDPRIAPGIQISPARFDLKLKSGDEGTGKINIKNYSERNYDVEIGVEDFYVSDDSSESIFFTPDKRPELKVYDVINWIETEKNLTLAPGEGKDVPFKIKVPGETPTGGYYGAIFFKTTIRDDIANEETSKITVHQRIGLLLTMAIQGSGAIERSGDIVKFGPKSRVFFSSPATLIADIANKGNIHYKGEGKIEISRFGKKIGEIELKPQIIYPNKFRRYEEKWELSVWDYGQYQAKINFKSEDGKIVISKEMTFWSIPGKTTAYIAGFLILWIGFKWLKRKLKRRREKNNQLPVPPMPRHV